MGWLIAASAGEEEEEDGTQRGGGGCSQPCAPGAPRGARCPLSLYKRSLCSSRGRLRCDTRAGEMGTGLGTEPALAVTLDTCGLAWPCSPAVPLGPTRLLVVSAVPTLLAPGCTPAAHPCPLAVPSGVFPALGWELDRVDVPGWCSDDVLSFPFLLAG